VTGPVKNVNQRTDLELVHSSILGLSEVNIASFVVDKNETRKLVERLVRCIHDLVESLATMVVLDAVRCTSGEAGSGGRRIRGRVVSR